MDDPKVPLYLKFSAIPTIIYNVAVFKKNISLISSHLKSVGRTEPVFELNLAPSEKKVDLRNLGPIQAFFLSSYRVNVAS